MVTKFRVYYTFLILMSLLLLTSCSHVTRPDGPPNFYVDETKVPDALPKPERLAKFGNMPSYVVFGQRYYVMKSSDNYNAVGLASWYGTKFHQRRTSSGERYDLLSMTAAHKTLPLPTYVEVTNLRNHRKIIVKVNDRGPFATNRIIDLSYVAAKKLHMLGSGTTLVRVKAINPYRYAQSTPVFTSSKVNTFSSSSISHRHVYPAPLFASKQYSAVKPIRNFTAAQLYLQVGAFRNKLHALHLQQHLAALIPTPVKIAYPSATTTLYRVQLGPFKDVVTANKITLRLKQLGIKTNRWYGA